MPSIILEIEPAIEPSEEESLALALAGVKFSRDSEIILVLEAALSEAVDEVRHDLENVTGDSWVGGPLRYADELEKHAARVDHLARHLVATLRRKEA
jgi:hypothetical protein